MPGAFLVPPMRPADSTVLDADLELLTSPYRRRVLLAVSAGGLLAEDEVAAAVFDADTTDDADLDALEQKLVRSHLPRLAADGYIEWDPGAGRLRRGPAFDEIELRLRALVDRDSGTTDDRP